MSGSIPEFTWPGTVWLFVPPLHFASFHSHLPLAALLSDLSWNQLSGAIPSSVAQRTGANAIYLHVNRLSGSLPAVWNLPNIIDINLSENKLSGDIPSGMSAISNSVEKIILDQNQFTGAIPTWLSTKTLLKSLALSSNRWTPATFPTFLFSLSYLTEFRLRAANLIGDLPSVQFNASWPALGILDLSDNNLACPTLPIRPIFNCIMNGNDFCTANRTFILQPNCATIPTSCRATPCFQSVPVIPVPAVVGACTGKIVEIQQASPSIQLLFEACLPKATMAFRTADGRTISVSASIQNFTDTGGDYIYNSWPAINQKWDLSYSFVASKNNSKVPQMVYKGVLPNGANFSVPFQYYENADSLRIFQDTLPVFPKTLKFGMDIDNWKPSTRRFRPYLGMDVLIETSEGFTITAEDVRAFFNGTSVKTLKIAFVSGPVMYIRIPTLGQRDYNLDLASSVNSKDPRVTSLLARGLAELPFDRMELPIVLAVGLIGRVSYDPDLSLVFDFVDTTAPGAPPALLALDSGLPGGAIAGIFLGIAAFVAIAAVAIVIIASPAARHKMLPFLRRRTKEDSASKEPLDDVEDDSPSPSHDNRRSSAWTQARPSIQP